MGLWYTTQLSNFRTEMLIPPLLGVLTINSPQPLSEESHFAYVYALFQGHPNLWLIITRVLYQNVVPLRSYPGSRIPCWLGRLRALLRLRHSSVSPCAHLGFSLPRQELILRELLSNLPHAYLPSESAY